MTPAVRRWKWVCAYDGRSFSGWQSQPDGNAVQDWIERRLRQVLGCDIRIHGSGRTDAGVHALGQVFHFDATWAHGAPKLLAAVRAGLPPAIQMRSVRPVAPSFHARFSATGKVYFYQLHQGGPADPFLQPFCWSIPCRLEVEAMRDGARRLIGRHDFRAFAACNGVSRENTVRQLRRFDLAGRGARLRITAEADGFLYKMVRSLAGALLKVGAGKLPVENIKRILASKQRTALVETAPPQGLCLVKVKY